MLLAKIEQVIQSRNYGLRQANKLVFRQLFFFTYKDGAPMISFGGFLDTVDTGFDLSRYNLQNFEFIMNGDERYNIEPPNLTQKEIFLLNAHLPNTGADFIRVAEIDFIPLSERNKYRQLYKYLPTYMDVIY